MTDTDTSFEQALEPLIRGRLEYRAVHGDTDAQHLLDRVTQAWAEVARSADDDPLDAA